MKTILIKIYCFVPEISNLEDVTNFEKEKIEWKEEEFIDPTKKANKKLESEKDIKALNELNKKESEINFLRGDILHHQNEITWK